MSGLIAHIGGASGAGKSTLLAELQRLHPHLVTKDIDEIDYDAKKQLGYPIPIDTYTNTMHKTLGRKKQELSNAFLAANKDKQVIYAGIHNDDSAFDVPAQQKLLLDVSPLQATWRAWKRNQGTDDHIPFSKLQKYLRDNSAQYHKFVQDNYTPVSSTDALRMIVSAISQKA